MGYTTFFHHRMRLEVSSIFSHPQFNCVPWWPPLQRLEETPPNKKSKPLSRYMIRPQFRDSIYWISKTSKPNLRKAPLHDVWPLKLNALKQQSLKLPAMSESMIRSSSCTFQSVKISIPSQSPDCCQSFPTHHHLKTTEFRSGKGHKTSTRPFMEGILNDLKCTYIYYIYIYHVNHGIHQPVHPRGTNTTCIKIWVSSCQGSNRDLHPPLGPLPDVIVHVLWKFEATGC